jgi:hypothetical protein
MTRATDLEWFDLAGELFAVPGWDLSVGCVWTQEPGDAPSVQIHEAEVNTGQRIIHLNVADIPRVWEWESRVSEMIEERQLNERAA